MNKGDIILAKMPVEGYSFKLRPVLIINIFPPYNDLFVCGISSQIHQHIEGLSFIIRETEDFFEKSGLSKSSVIRINYLATIPEARVYGRIGSIPNDIFKQILAELIKLIQV